MLPVVFGCVSIRTLPEYLLVGQELKYDNLQETFGSSDAKIVIIHVGELLPRIPFFKTQGRMVGKLLLCLLKHLPHSNWLSGRNPGFPNCYGNCLSWIS